MTQLCQSRSTRSRSSGWIEFSQPLPRYSSADCPVIHRHSGESSLIAPSGPATQTTWAPPWTSERYRSSLRLISSSAARPDALDQDEADTGDLPRRVVHGEPGRGARPLGLQHQHAVGQDLPQRGFRLRRGLLRPHVGGQQARVPRRVPGRRAVEPGQGGVGQPEAKVGPEQRKADRRLVQEHVHQSGIGYVLMHGY